MLRRAGNDSDLILESHKILQVNFITGTTNARRKVQPILALQKGRRNTAEKSMDFRSHGLATKITETPRGSKLQVRFAISSKLRRKT
jgi:hypothetical protein